MSVQNSKKNCVWKSYIWDPAKCANGKNDKDLGSIIDNSFVCDEIIETTKSILKRTVLTKSTSTNFNGKWKFIYFTYLFSNYHEVINSC